MRRDAGRCGISARNAAAGWPGAAAHTARDGGAAAADAVTGGEPVTTPGRDRAKPRRQSPCGLGSVSGGRRVRVRLVGLCFAPRPGARGWRYARAAVSPCLVRASPAGRWRPWSARGTGSPLPVAAKTGYEEQLRHDLRFFSHVRQECNPCSPCNLLELHGPFFYFHQGRFSGRHRAGGKPPRQVGALCPRRGDCPALAVCRPGPDGPMPRDGSTACGALAKPARSP